MYIEIRLFLTFKSETSVMSMFVSQAAKTSLALAVAVCLSAGMSHAAERVSTSAQQSVSATSHENQTGAELRPAYFHSQPTGFALVPAYFHSQPTGLELLPATFHSQPTGLELVPAYFHSQPTGFAALQSA